MPLVGLALVLALAGCAGSSIKVNWRGSSGTTQQTASYETFTGQERATIRLEAGDTLTLAYDIEVAKGSLTLAVDDPDGETVWEQTFGEGGGDTVVVPTTGDGRYTLRIVGDDTGGRFDVSWRVGE